jgi:hypothetical protein
MLLTILRQCNGAADNKNLRDLKILRMLVFLSERDKRGWPLLTFETEANGVQMKGALPWLVRWACWAGTRDFCPALAALVGQVQTIIFLTAHFFSSFVFIAQQAGQAFVPQCLSLNTVYVTDFFAF